MLSAISASTGGCGSDSPPKVANAERERVRDGEGGGGGEEAARRRDEQHEREQEQQVIEAGQEVHDAEPQVVGGDARARAGRRGGGGHVEAIGVAVEDGGQLAAVAQRDAQDGFVRLVEAVQRDGVAAQAGAVGRRDRHRRRVEVGAALQRRRRVHVRLDAAGGVFAQLDEHRVERVREERAGRRQRDEEPDDDGDAQLHRTT